MIYSAGRTCPICFDSSDIIFLKNVSSNQVFLSCYACGCAWDSLPGDATEFDRVPLDFAPDGFSLASFEDLKVSGLASLIVEILPDDDLIFDRDKGFIAPERNPQDYNGKTVFIYLSIPLANGENERGGITGKLQYECNKLILNIEDTSEHFEIEREWLSHIRPMTSSVFSYSEYDLDLSLTAEDFPNKTLPDFLIDLAKRRQNQANDLRNQ